MIVTHNMQQAARVSDATGFFSMDGVGQPGHLVEFDDTRKIFSSPSERKDRGLHHRPIRMSDARSPGRLPPWHRPPCCAAGARPPAVRPVVPADQRARPGRVAGQLLEDLARVNVRVVASSDGARAVLDAGLVQPGAPSPRCRAACPRGSGGHPDRASGVGQPHRRRCRRGARTSWCPPDGRRRRRSSAATTVPGAAELRALLLTVRGSRELDNVLLTAGDLTVDPLAYEVRLAAAAGAGASAPAGGPGLPD